MRVLLIEDEPALGAAVEEHIRDAGHAVDRVLRLDDAEAALRAVDYGLVLLDLNLPDGSGLTLLKAMRRANDVRPVIILTARDQVRDRIEGLNAGADDYLVKPAPRLELLEAIHARLDRQRLNDERLKESLAAIRFRPDFSSALPLVERLNLTEREAETLLWVAQGKSNSDIAGILGNSERTVKKTLGHIVEKLGLESRTAAALRAVEVLSGPVVER